MADETRKVFAAQLGSLLVRVDANTAIPPSIGEPVGEVKGDHCSIVLGTIGLFVRLHSAILPPIEYAELDVSWPDLRAWYKMSQTGRGQLELGPRGGQPVCLELSAPAVSGLVSSFQNLQR